LDVGRHNDYRSGGTMIFTERVNFGGQGSMNSRAKEVNDEIKILYEDNHLLVVEKPPNVLSQSDDTGDADMLNLLKADIKKRYNKPGNVYLGLVHRLDRPVGGVMVFAKTSKCASRLSEQIRQHEFKKKYLAVVHGTFKKSYGRLEDYLLKDSSTNTVKVVDSSNDKSLKAVLEYEVIGESSSLSLVKINLITGRPHQIRVQFSHSGHPLYGDRKYGKEHNKDVDQIALWAVEITCKHPTLQKEMTFTSNPPNIYPWNIFIPK